MSQRLISLSPDLHRLQAEGYDVGICSNHLLVRDVPYVNAAREVKRGVLVSKLTLAGDITAQPDDHVAHFVGEHPCNSDGTPIEKIRNASNVQTLGDGVVIQHTFSAKPKPHDRYVDYYAKVTTYVAILGGPASELEPSATAKTFPVIEPDFENPAAIFQYLDTASSRAEIEVVTRKLELRKIAIVGLGGTGSYVLDLVAKTPVREIHLFDGDVFLQHNAFRSPGAPSIEQLRKKPFKATFFEEAYSKMHRGIIGHPVFVDASNVAELNGMDFVFLCMDSGDAKRIIIEYLEQLDCQFVDVGMGINMNGDSLGGILRVTTSTVTAREHLRTRVSLVEAGDVRNEYNRNIQVADLNALNAALAVMKWKKLYGFYRDFKHEHNSTFAIDGNLLLSEDRLA